MIYNNKENKFGDDLKVELIKNSKIQVAAYVFYDQKLFMSEWNQQVMIDYNSSTITKLYDSMRLRIIKQDYKNNEYITIITNIIKIEELNSKIQTLIKKRKQEKQRTKSMKYVKK